jgi:hypothetical protein
LPQEDSFMKLKELVTSALVLVLPDDDLPFWLEADGSRMSTQCTTTVGISQCPYFAPGDKVWLDRSDIAINWSSSKLSHRWLGPFTVKDCVGHRAYCLTLPPQLWCLHLVFLVLKLSLALPDPIPGYKHAPPPPLMVVDGKNEYEVEEE